MVKTAAKVTTDKKIDRSTNGRVVKTSTRHGQLTVAQVRKAVESVSRRKA